MVGAVLVKNGKVIGRGWHHRAGEPHAEIEAIRDAQARHAKVAGATLYVTLEPCSTHGRTPPCTDAIQAAGIRRVVIGAIDPNPAHSGKGLEVLRRAGIQITTSVLAEEATALNEAFNHWIVKRTPFVTVKAAMSIDGKIATTTGESKWITSSEARNYGMGMRRGADAILAGVNTVLKDDPSLTWRGNGYKQLRRIILDSRGRTPLQSRVASDEFAALTTVVVSKAAPSNRVAALSKRVTVWIAPSRRGGIELRWLLKRLGAENVTGLLVEGGGEVNASFLFQRLAHRIVFFYAPKIIGGRDAVKAVAGEGFKGLDDAVRLREVRWRMLGPDLLLTARSD
jgi:diaminohydroxyphosphoribosylaminopyrimidine deaminase/5-amino-6-(5-phosphoribosylamino)uracil reductase